MKSQDPANILVFCIVFVFVSFVILAAIKSRLDDREGENGE